MYLKKVIIFLLLLATNAYAEDCTYGGKYSWTTCYGLEHAVIEAVTIKGVDMIEEPLGLPSYTSRIAGGAACVAFIYREMQGSDWFFKEADPTLDWLVPCAIGAFYDPGSKNPISITNVVGGEPVRLGVRFSLDF